MIFDKNRKVGEEVSKWYHEWIDNGMLEKYLAGDLVLDIGATGYLDNTTTIHENAQNIDMDTPNYDGVTLPFKTNSVDAILSSHMLEHVKTENVKKTIKEWHRVLKFNRYMVITVPHKFLYERKHENKVNPIPGSHWNGGHERFYTPSSLLSEIEESLPPNTYRIELLKDNDKGYDYSIPPHIHARGCLEILLIVKKLKFPGWKLIPGLSSKHKQNRIIDHTGKVRLFKENKQK